jgi:hypothetical protein
VPLIRLIDTVIAPSIAGSAEGFERPPVRSALSVPGLE